MKTSLFNKSRLLTLVAVVFWAAPLLAQRRGDEGFGAMIGNPTGVSAKMWLNETVALDGAAGVDRGEFDIHADLLWHNFGWTANMKNGPDLLAGPGGRGELPLYFGVGPRLLFADNKEFGLRFPLGISYLPKDQPWETFFEVAPVLRVSPDTGFNGDFAVGFRYYFSAIRSQASAH